MADSAATLEMYDDWEETQDDGVQLRCIRKGCAPLFQAWYNGQNAPLHGDHLSASISITVNPTTTSYN